MFDMYSTPKDLMMRLRFLVSKGYVFFTHDQVPRKVKKKLMYKFVDRYETDATDGQRKYRAKMGRCHSRLVWFDDGQSDMISFWLLSTQGEGLIFEVETMLDCRNKKTRICFLNDGYELLRMPRANDKSRWTWKMTERYVNEMKSQIRIAVRHHKMFTLKQLHFSLVRTYGFSGTRKQGFALLNYLKNEWIRVRKEPYPFKSDYIGYIKITSGKSKKSVTAFPGSELC